MNDKKPDFYNFRKRKTSSAENLLTLRRPRSAFIGYFIGLINKISEKLPLTVLKRLSGKRSSYIRC